MKKITVILVLLILMSMVINLNIVFASGGPEGGTGEGDGEGEGTISSITSATSIVESMKPANDMSKTSNRFGNILNTIIGLFQVVGTGIAVIVVAILGMKYMMAAPAEKADTKKSIMPILVGCVLLFGGVNLMAAVYDFAKKVLKN